MLPSSPTSSNSELAIDSGSINVDHQGDRIAVMYSFDSDSKFDFDFDGLDSFDLEDDIVTIENEITINANVVLNSNTEFKKLENSGPDGFVSGILIQLFSDEYPIDPDPGTPGNQDPAYGAVAFGCIWIFDLGQITYETYGGGVNEKVIYENCADIRHKSNSPYIEYSSNIKNEENDVIKLSLGLIRGVDKAVSGGGNYNLEFEVLNNYVRNKVQTEVYNFKIMITGDYKDAWYTYLTNTYDFEEQVGEDYLLFNNGEKTDMVFSTYVIKINDISI